MADRKTIEMTIEQYMEETDGLGIEADGNDYVVAVDEDAIPREYELTGDGDAKRYGDGTGNAVCKKNNIKYHIKRGTQKIYNKKTERILNDPIAAY